jgi:hypothetical protein
MGGATFVSSARAAGDSCPQPPRRETFCPRGEKERPTGCPMGGREVYFWNRKEYRGETITCGEPTARENRFSWLARSGQNTLIINFMFLS